MTEEVPLVRKHLEVVNITPEERKLKQPYFTPSQVAQHFAVTPRTVLNWIKSGALVAFKLNERVWRILESDLRAFERSGKAHSDTFEELYGVSIDGVSNAENEEQDYSEGKIYTFSALDKKGGGMKITFNMPGWFHGRLQEILRDFPEYEGIVSNFVRDSMFHRMKWCEAIGPSTDRLWESLSEIEHSRQESSTQLKRLRDLEIAVAAYIRQKDWIAMDQFLAVQMQHAHRVRDPWRNRLLIEIQKGRVAREAAMADNK